MSNNVSMPAETVQNIIGFVEVNKDLLEKSAAQQEALREAASKTVDELVKRSFVEEGQREAVIEGFIEDPTKAMDIITKFAEDLTEAHEKQAQAVKEAQEASERTQPIGTPDIPETTKSASASRESDDLWNKGFGL